MPPKPPLETPVNIPVPHAAIPDYPHYWAGIDGSIWSSKCGRLAKLTPTPSRQYLRVNMRDRGRSRPVGVHRLMLLAFVGPQPPGMECRHLDGDPRNNDLSNLCWGTHKENALDTIRHGRVFKGRGKKNPRSKLCEETVREVFSLSCQRLTHRAIADRFGVSHRAIGYILLRKTWRHVDVPPEILAGSNRNPRSPLPGKSQNKGSVRFGVTGLEAEGVADAG